MLNQLIATGILINNLLRTVGRKFCVQLQVRGRIHYVWWAVCDCGCVNYFADKCDSKWNAQVSSEFIELYADENDLDIREHVTEQSTKPAHG